MCRGSGPLKNAAICHHQTGARWLAAQRPIDVLKKPNAGEITPLILVLVLSTINSILYGSGNHVGFLGGDWVACPLWDKLICLEPVPNLFSKTFAGGCPI